MKLFTAESYIDKRGIIMNCTPMNPVLRNVMYITGKKGSVRGNHMHKKDIHYCMVIKGVIEYFWKEGNKSGLFESILLNPGDIVLSEAGELHKFKFLTDGVFIAMAREPRTQKSYEEDTIRKDYYAK